MLAGPSSGTGVRCRPPSDLVQTRQDNHLVLHQWLSGLRWVAEVNAILSVTDLALWIDEAMVVSLKSRYSPITFRPILVHCIPLIISIYLVLSSPVGNDRAGCCQSPVPNPTLPPDAFACWWRPFGVAWDAVTGQSWLLKLRQNPVF